jgi:hypothetical protein
VTLALPFGPHPCNPFALVTSPKLGLQQLGRIDKIQFTSFTQTFEVDYNETFAFVAKIFSIRSDALPTP